MIKKKIRGGYFYTKRDLKDIVKNEDDEVIGIKNKDINITDSECIQDQISYQCILPQHAYFINGKVYDIDTLYRTVYENNLMNYINHSEFHKLFIGIMYQKKLYEQKLKEFQYLYSNIYEEWDDFKFFTNQKLMNFSTFILDPLNDLFINKFVVFFDQDAIKNKLNQIKIELFNFYRFTLVSILEEVLVPKSNLDNNHAQINKDDLIDTELFQKIKLLFKKTPIINLDYKFDNDIYISDSISDETKDQKTQEFIQSYDHPLKYFSKRFRKEIFHYIFTIQIRNIIHFEKNKIKYIYTSSHSEKYINVLICLAKYYIFKVFICQFMKKYKKLQFTDHFDNLLLKHISIVFEHKIFKILDSISQLEHKIINTDQSRTSKTSKTTRTFKILSSDTRKIRSKTKKSV
jgi:hypothetical protein